MSNGGYDQRPRNDTHAAGSPLPLSERSDVLVFRTEPLEEDLEVTGTVKVREERLPRSVNTHPELAAVGLTEAEAAARGIQPAVGFADLAASPRALTLDRAAGALKLVVDPEFGEILGAHMVGVGASEVIAQVAVAMELEADYRDLTRVAHIHPSLAELVTDAAASI